MGAKKRNEIHWTINPANDNEAVNLRFTEMDGNIKIGIGIDNGKSQIVLEMGLPEFEAFIDDLGEFKELVNAQIIFKTQITKFSPQSPLGTVTTEENKVNLPVSSPDTPTLPQPTPISAPVVNPKPIPTIKPQIYPVIQPKQVVPIIPAPSPVKTEPSPLVNNSIPVQTEPTPESFNMEETLKNLEAMDSALNTLTENFNENAIDNVKPLGQKSEIPEPKLEAPKVMIPHVTPPESKAALSKKEDKSKLKESDWDPW